MAPLDASNVCHAKSSMRDVAGFVLTEQEAVLDWGWDGAIVTYSGAGNSIGRWLSEDGWHITYGPNWYKYSQPDPYVQSGEGWIGYAWIGGSYAHEHRAILSVNGGGGCYADYYYSGNVVGNGSVTYATYTGP